MTQYELLSLVIGSGTILVGVGTIWAATISNKTNKNIARRQGVIELHQAWGVIKDIHTEKGMYISPDIVNAINALNLTASLWLHDVLEKKILFQSYWDAYKELYDKLIIMDDVIPGYKFTPRSKITPDIKRVYQEMLQKEISKTETSKL